jgi:hypothetical protein
MQPTSVPAVHSRKVIWLCLGWTRRHSNERNRRSRRLHRFITILKPQLIAIKKKATRTSALELPGLIVAPTILRLLLHLPHLLLVHLGRPFVNVLRLLSVRKSDVPITRGCTSLRPIMTVTGDGLLVGGDGVVPPAVPTRFPLFGAVRWGTPKGWLQAAGERTDRFIVLSVRQY